MDRVNWIFSKLGRAVSLLVLTLIITFAASAAQALPGPTSATFAKGVMFTVAGYTNENGAARAELQNFPVLVRIAANSPSGFSYGDLQSKSTGDDIAFVGMDGGGLPFEIDTWDPNGTSLVWVRLPSMTNGTEFVMCWGSTSSGKAVCNANPWSDYTGVWHMGETGTPSSSSPVTIHDSTANGLDGSTPAGKAASGSVIGGAWRIAEDNNHDRAIRVPVGGSAADPAKKAASDALGTDFHASFWVRAKGAVQWSNLICRRKGDQGTGWGFSFHENNGSTPKLMRVYAGGTTPATSSGTYNLGATLSKTDDVWKKIDVVWKYASNNNAQVADLYLNGAYVETVTCIETANQQDTDIGIGCSTQDSYNSSDTNKKGRRVNAEMDEVRLGAFVPSADWIAADYATQSSTSFLTAGMAQPYEETGDPVAGVFVPAASLGYTNATVSVSISSFGGDATSADVTVQVSTSSDFSDIRWVEDRLISVVGSPTFYPVGLSCGTTYYVRAVLDNGGDGEPFITPVVTFTTLTPGAAAGTATFLERGFTTLSASATAMVFGTGSESAAIRLEASTDGFATVIAGAESPATAGEPATVDVSGLTPDTEYALRVRIRNEWGVDKYIELPSAYTRAVPFATTGLGWTFSADGSTIDIDFGVSGIYDGATGSATLYYGESADPTASQGERPVNTAGDLSWQGLPVSASTMYAKVVLSATLNGQTYSQTNEAPIVSGSTAVSVSDIMEHASAATAVRVHAGDVVTLPELSGSAQYIVGNKLFGSLDGNVLTALRPGILGIHCVDNESNTNTLAVLVLPEKIGNGDIYIFKDERIKDNWGYWNEAANWEKLGSETNDSWPHNPDDIAIVAYYKNTGVQFDARDEAVELAELYAGGYRDDKASITLRCVSKDKADNPLKNKYSFRRTDGKAALIQLCSNSTYLGNNAYRTILTFANSVIGLEFLSDTILSGGWDGTNPNFPQGRFGFSAPTNRITDGITVTLVEMDTQPQGNSGYTMAIGNLAGGGTFWNRSAAMVRVTGDSGAFTGLIRDSGGLGAGTTDRTGPTFVRTTTTTNCQGEVIGWVARKSDASPDDNFTHGVGCFQTGGTHSYNVPEPHDPWFTKKGFSMHGGMLRIGSDGTTAWGTRPDKRLVDFFRVGGGFNYIYGYNNNANNNIAWFEADSVSHEGTGTLRIRDQSLFESSATNIAVYLHGIAQYAVGKGEDPKTSNAASIVPWIVAQAGSKQDEDLRFAAFDAKDRLSKVLHSKTENVPLSNFGPQDNAYIWKGGISLSADATVNSLSIVNEEKEKQLGEGRTLTLTSGGLILGDISWLAGSSGIGTEDGGSANGALVLGDVMHPAYVWARGADTVSEKAGPNEIWAPVTASGGFVAAHTGALILGGNQTGIANEIAVNAGVLQLGTADNSCLLAKDLPIRIFANATLKLPNASSTTGNILKFDGAAGWFGKVEVPSGVAAKCRKAYWRDYPETQEWQNLKRGVYTGDEATALATGAIYDPDHFAGAGTLEVLKDDITNPLILRIR
ncbi:MAG: hypothetical protein J6Q49_07395 [Kiritimatiellae bacterium]|nr:hypothetical protein [Kiritimatiellia bacterium]